MASGATHKRTTEHADKSVYANICYSYAAQGCHAPRGTPTANTLGYVSYSWRLASKRGRERQYIETSRQTKRKRQRERERVKEKEIERKKERWREREGEREKKREIARRR